ncbi:hypothetical protein MMC06_000488 [Schaereria dolodes]|nr:hypothetical protein [Schaereria dolodes]
MPSLLLSLLALPTLLLAASLQLTIPPSNILPNPSTLPPSTHATLTTSGLVLSAPIQRSNSFSFNNIRPGSYLCDVYSRDYVFAPLRVDVSEQDAVEIWQTFRGNEWDNKGERIGAGSGSANADVRVVGERAFYESRGGLDPETKKEFEEQQKNSVLSGGTSAANPLQNFDMAAWMAGKTAKTSGSDEAVSSKAKKRG